MTCVWSANMGCCPEWADYPLDVRASARITASEILWSLTAQQFTGSSLATAFPDEAAELAELGYDLHGCAQTIRPCRTHAGPACDTCGWPGGTYGWYAPWIPYLRDGTWYNATCGTCGDSCQCDGTLDELILPGPVAAVENVYLDGQVFTDWALYNANILVRTDHAGPWPRCQDLTSDLTAEGTWAVTYVKGAPVPEGGKRAAGILACELARLCARDKRCRIPANVVSVTRDGVSFDLDPTTYYKAGLTGIPEVDLWITTVNAGGNRRPSGVYTPQTLGRDWQRRTPDEVLPS